MDIKVFKYHLRISGRTHKIWHDYFVTKKSYLLIFSEGTYFVTQKVDSYLYNLY